MLWHLALLASFYHTTSYNILSYKILQHTSVAFSIRRKKFLQKSLDSFKEGWNFPYSSFFQKFFGLSERILLTQFRYDLYLFSIWFRLQLWVFWIIESPTIRTVIFLIFRYVMHIDLVYFTRRVPDLRGTSYTSATQITRVWHESNMSNTCVTHVRHA